MIHIPKIIIAKNCLTIRFRKEFITDMANGCLFCRIAGEKIAETALMYSNEKYAVFKDHKPILRHYS